MEEEEELQVEAEASTDGGASSGIDDDVDAAFESDPLIGKAVSGERIGMSTLSTTPPTSINDSSGGLLLSAHG